MLVAGAAAERTARSRFTCPPIGSSLSLCCVSTKATIRCARERVYDTEETKSTGLANRLLAEQARPQADVFWSNEPVRTLVLKSRGCARAVRSPNAQGIPSALVDPDGYWTGFSARIRVIAYNTKLVKRRRHRGPCSIWLIRSGEAGRDRRPAFRLDVVPRRRALRRARRREGDDFFRRLKANGVRVVDGNSRRARSRRARRGEGRADRYRRCQRGDRGRAADRDGAAGSRGSWRSGDAEHGVARSRTRPHPDEGRKR